MSEIAVDTICRASVVNSGFRYMYVEVCKLPENS